MNITNVVSQTFSFFIERLSLSLTHQQKKIIIVASIAFGCLAALYALGYCGFKVKDEDYHNELEL